MRVFGSYYREVIMKKKIKKIVINNSSLELFKACPRKFYKKIVLGQQVPEDTLAMRLGSAVHEFIEEVTLNPFQEYSEMLRRIHKNWDLPPYDKGDFPHFAGICRGYVRRYIKEDGKDLMYPAAIAPDGEILVEKYLETCIDEKENIWINGTIDRISETESGQIYLFDTKTTSAASFWTQNMNRKAHLTPQLTHYTYLMMQAGLKPDGCVIDLVSTSQHHSVKNHYDRLSTTRSDARIASWLAETTYYCKLIKDCIENETFPRNMGDNCSAFNKPCPYLKSCMNPGDAEQPYAISSPQSFKVEYE